MAKTKTDEKVMAMVEKELEKNPDVSVDELQAKGASINNDVASLTARQFHARYPLQVKRRKAMASDAAAPKKTKRSAKKATKRKKATKAKKAAKAKRSAGRKDRAAEKAASAAAGEAVDRDAVRKAFLGFASELTAAEARKDLVKVLAGVDKYVDQVEKAAGR